MGCKVIVCMFVHGGGGGVFYWGILLRECK